MEADETCQCDLLLAGDLAGLQEAAVLVEGFPQGMDSWGHAWIGRAVDVAPWAVIAWMIETGVGLEVAGEPPVMRAIDRSAGLWPDPDRHEILRRLIAAGAPLQARGMNDGTALHLAGLRGDLVALEILLAAGADRRARTCIDGYATPEEEARALGQPVAADLLRDWRNPLSEKWER